MKLLLSSFGPSAAHDAALSALVGRPLERIKVGYIENADDPYEDPSALDEGRDGLRRRGYDFDLVDLRNWRTDREGLRSAIASFDAFLVAGGNPYYLRSLLALTGADEIITERLAAGAVYAGASAGAVVAGPTLRHFDQLDDPSEAELLVWDGLGLRTS
jgi:dipeptidase E